MMNIRVSNRRIGLRSSVGVVALALAAPAIAQDAEVTGETEEAAATAIVVTGTRIQRPEAATATPVIAVTQENITQSGITNVTELLSQVPALFNSEDNFDAAGSQARTGAAGVNLLNLRGLGANRMTPLVDCRRHLAGVASDAEADTNTILVALIQRVDILTCGASSIYGADGASGVVNFIMQHDFERINARAPDNLCHNSDADYPLS